MSVRHLAVAAEILGLSPASKSLLLALCMECDGTGHTSATNYRLSEITCLSERAVRANLRKLEDLRFINPSKDHRFVVATWNFPVTL